MKLYFVVVVVSLLEAVGGLVPSASQQERRRRRVRRHIVLEECDDACLLPPGEEEMMAAQKAMFAKTAMFDRSLRVFPIASPIIAYASYESVAKLARALLDFFGQRQTWVAVDSHVYEIAILAPLINGVVMPSVSIALGTLAATTISTLRQRQLDVREHLNCELGEIELLRATISTMDDDDWNDRPSIKEATLLLRDYVGRVAIECRPDASPRGRSFDTELNLMYKLFLDVQDGAKRSNPASATALVLVDNLVKHRAGRLTLLENSYPPTQFLVLLLGSCSIVVAFLLESDQEVLRFLDAIQLRILFSILVGVCSGLASVLVDLSDIHRGTFRITPVAAQLFSLRDTLTYDLCCRDDFDENDDDAARILQGYTANPGRSRTEQNSTRPSSLYSGDGYFPKEF